MVDWQEYALLASTVISAVGTIQAIMSLPKAMKQTNNPTERTNMISGTVGGVIGTAMNYDQWRRARNQRATGSRYSQTAPVRPGVVKLGHIVA